MKAKLEWIGWCQEGGHDKIWAILALSDTSFATIWGRRGKQLQSKTKDGGSWERKSLIRAKISKGYVQIPTADLDRVYPEFRDDINNVAMMLVLQY